VKLFQIEEPDGTPVDPDMPGAAVGIDLCGAEAAVAVSVGGNAEILKDREGFELSLAVPPLDAPVEEWELLFEGARLRAERALSQPVTHAVIALAALAEANLRERLERAAETAGLSVLRLVGGMNAGEAAILAEDLAPRLS
jgi:molecular chaperone DnaK (HSP70)